MKAQVHRNALLLVFLLLTACGSSRHVLSLTISPTSAQNTQTPFTATATFDKAPRSVTPATVQWFQSFPIFDPPGGNTMTYNLTSQSFTPQCFQGTSMTIVAFAPVDTGAPATGQMPMNVFLDLAVRRTTTAEAGFIAATAQLTCP